MKKLMNIPSGSTITKHLDELKTRQTGHDEYASSMKYPKEIVEKRFGRLELEGRPAEVTEYASKEDMKILLDALSKFDPSYDFSITSRVNLRKMPFIERLLSCPNHCQRTEFTFELRMLDNGKDDCDLCDRIKRGIRIVYVKIGGYNLQKEVLRWMDLPIPDPSDGDHFLSPTHAREYIDINDVSFDELKKMMPDVKADTIN